MNRTIEVIMDAMTNQRFIQRCEVDMTEWSIRLKKQKDLTKRSSTRKPKEAKK